MTLISLKSMFFPFEGYGLIFNYYSEFGLLGSFCDLTLTNNSWIIIIAKEKIIVTVHLSKKFPTCSKPIYTNCSFWLQEKFAIVLSSAISFNAKWQDWQDFLQLTAFSLQRGTASHVSMAAFNLLMTQLGNWVWYDKLRSPFMFLCCLLF